MTKETERLESIKQTVLTTEESTFKTEFSEEIYASTGKVISRSICYYVGLPALLFFVAGLFTCSLGLIVASLFLSFILLMTLDNGQGWRFFSNTITRDRFEEHLADVVKNKIALFEINTGGIAQLSSYVDLSGMDNKNAACCVDLLKLSAKKQPTDDTYNYSKMFKEIRRNLQNERLAQEKEVIEAELVTLTKQ